MFLVDAAGWLSWIAAYLLGAYAIHRHGRSRLRYALVLIGLALGFIVYLVIAWRFGRWPVLYTGLTLTAGFAAFLAVMPSRNYREASRAGR